MSRLLSWPLGLGYSDFEFLSGPRSVGESQNTSISDYTQRVTSPFGGWVFQVQFPNLQGSMSREHRGMITALHGGANAVRFTFTDGDRMSLSEAGVLTSESVFDTGQPWSNDETWSNGQNWQSSLPAVTVAAAAAQGDTIVRLSNEYWGHGLREYGDLIGFAPLHLGVYMITESFGDGVYRIWPRLRKTLTTTDRAVYPPTMAVRLLNFQAAKVQRDVEKAGNLTAVFAEVFDYRVRENFSG